MLNENACFDKKVQLKVQVNFYVKNVLEMWWFHLGTEFMGDEAFTD